MNVFRDFSIRHFVFLRELSVFCTLRASWKWRISFGVKGGRKKVEKPKKGAAKTTKMDKMDRAKSVGKGVGKLSPYGLLAGGGIYGAKKAMD